MSISKFKTSYSAPYIIMTAAAVYTAIATADANAHHVTVAGPASSAGPINTETADTLPKGKFSVSVQAQTENYEELSNEALEGFAINGIEGVHNTDATYIASLATQYGVTDDFSIGVVAPYVLRYGIREGEVEHGDPHTHMLGDTRGFGDLVVSAKYRVLNRVEDDFSLAFIVGVKAPTGETEEESLGHGHNLFEAEFQPGSGSWDPHFGIAAGKNFGPFSVAGNVRYTVATEGEQDTDLGDTFAYNLGVSYRFGEGAHTHADGTFERHHALDLIVEVNGEWGERERVGDFLDPHSGGTKLFVSPGLRYSSPWGWNSFVSVGFPVYEDLNGIQNETDVRGTFGIGASF
ncbi:MAG: hypothetical protein DHS20C05_17380 [Hyphococcus sp.]|nr:MAG: hypothetical protein DHS20C05_17380 [Marinicaulis sp.]